MFNKVNKFCHFSGCPRFLSFLHINYPEIILKNFVTFISTVILLHIFSLNISANVSPYIVFSQEITAFDETGSQYPTVAINPANIKNMQTHTFALGQSQKLVIETNITAAENRRLAEFAETIQRSYAFVEESTGRTIDENILIYVIEFDRVPEYYSFRKSFSKPEAIWGEVRLVLVQKNDTLHGPDAPDAVHELLYDTLPHELGHDVLSGITNLLHDIGSRDSYHTRWFIEGVCELLAKNFSRTEVPRLWESFLARRNVDAVLGNRLIRENIFQWAQENTNSPTLESDLYGASMLVLIRWSRVRKIRQILDWIQVQEKPLAGAELVTMMESATGLSREVILDQGHLLGKNLLHLTANSETAEHGKI